MAISTIGATRFKIYAVLLLVNTVVLALSGHVNHFQSFYYKADVFPFALSIVTTIFILTMILWDTGSANAVTARPAFELGWLVTFALLWLGFNSFSSSRWRNIGPGLCKTIPNNPEYGGYRTWCNEIQALRAVAWIEWVLFFLTFVYLLKWTLSRHYGGRSDVWSTSFSRFQELQSQQVRAPSEFLQWEKFGQQDLNAPAAPAAIRDDYPTYTSGAPATTAYARAQQLDVASDHRYPSPSEALQQMQYAPRQESHPYTQYVNQSGAQFTMTQAAHPAPGQAF